MNKKKNTGFDRLKNKATVAMVAGVGAMGLPVGTLRAASQSFRVSLSFSSVGVDNRSFNITGIDNTGNVPEVSFAYSGDFVTEIPLSKMSNGFEVSELNNFRNSTGAGTLSDSHDGLFAYFVGDTKFLNPDSTVDLTGNDLTTDVVTDIASGVDAMIELRFFDDRSAIRGILTLTNTTANDISVPVAAAGNMGSDGRTTIHNTSSGDSTLTDSDLWVLSNDNNSANQDPLRDPVVVWAIQGEESILAGAKELIGYGSGEDSYAYQYNVTIPANSSVRIMNLAYFAFTNSEGIAEAEKFVNISALKTSGYVSDLTDAELATIVNFSAPEPEAATDDTVSTIRLGSGIGRLGYGSLLLLLSGFAARFGRASPLFKKSDAS